jgi:hypothetical protein
MEKGRAGGHVQGNCTMCVSEFCCDEFVDDCGTKNPYQNCLTLWRRENWKPVKILGREINSEVANSLTHAKVVWAHSMLEASRQQKPAL